MNPSETVQVVRMIREGYPSVPSERAEQFGRLLAARLPNVRGAAVAEAVGRCLDELTKFPSVADVKKRIHDPAASSSSGVFANNEGSVRFTNEAVKRVLDRYGRDFIVMGWVPGTDLPECPTCREAYPGAAHGDRLLRHRHIGEDDVTAEAVVQGAVERRLERGADTILSLAYYAARDYDDRGRRLVEPRNPMRGCERPALRVMA